MAFIPAVAAIVGAVGAAVAAAADFIGGVAVGLGLATSAGAVAAGVLGLVGFVGSALLTVAVNMAVTALTTPKIHARGSPLSFKADPSAGIPYCMGRCGVGGNVVAALTSYGDKNKFLHYVVALSGAGPIDSIESFAANETTVSFSSGAATTSPYTGKMWQVTQLGATTDGVLTTPPAAGSIPEWDGAHKMTGYAAARWALQFDPDVYPTGTPKPLWVVKGAKCYDPRLDSTYPGGSGSQRSNNKTTWAWSANPWINALTFILGQTENSKRVIGLGAPSAAIDFAAFVDAANVADTNSWTLGGQISSKDDKWQCLQAMAQAGGGQIVRLGAQISCIVQTPRVAIATITGADIIGEATVPGSQPRRSRINSVLARYQSEDHGWEMVAADKVSVSAYVTADGDTRTRSVDMPLVTDVDQVTQLAAYGIYDSRELGPITLPLKPYLMGLKAGDVATINEPALGLTSQDVLILTRQRDPQTGCPTLTCRTETSAKHAAALALTGTAPPTPTLTAVDLVPAAPSGSYWSAAGATLTSASGTSFPAIVITGTSIGDNPNATDLSVETKPHSDSSWSNYGIYPLPATTRVEFLNCTPGDDYDIRLRYRDAHGALSDPLEIDSITAGDFAASGASADVTPDAIAWGNISASSSTPAVSTTTTESVTGISTAIEIKPTYTGTGSLYYSVNGGTFTSIASGSTFFVSTGDTLAWRVSASSTASGTVTVLNHSDGDATLDTFTYSNTVTTGVTPSPTPNWNNISSSTGVGTDSIVAITGISSSITLLFNVVDLADPNATSYQKNGSGWVVFTDGDTLSMSNNDTLQFKVTTISHGDTGVGHISVTNQTDGNTLLDTISYTVFYP